jgi:hypothetical protein
VLTEANRIADCLCWESTGFIGMIHRNRKEVEVSDITLILTGQKTTSFHKRKSRNRASDDEAGRSFSVLTYHGALDLAAPTVTEANLWIRTLTLLQSASRRTDVETTDKFEEYIEEQWRRADTDRDNTVNVDECVVLMRKMNFEFPKQKVKEQMKGKSAMDLKEYHELMLTFMTKRPEIELLVKEIKQQFESKGSKGHRNDKEHLSIPELLFFMNSMQQTPIEPEITLQQISKDFMRSNSMKGASSVSAIQFAKILDHSKNSVVDPITTSPGCGIKVICNICSK